ncbi:hypothetical protein [Foetidibacter luteolus]|uniref:hypothetical protein n=1 Tax=Foetidibacter luteolus TaxID=2608880 RepID=UPI00129B5CEA|nr:hypothetical protein [Foetidibacter luteolus]
MSAKQSYLNNGGYEIIVATSQASINNIMEDYLSDPQLPSVTKYYVIGVDGEPELIDRGALMTRTSGIDPLSITSWDGSTSPDAAIECISNARFLCAFEAAIGLPPCYGDGPVPDIITLLPDYNPDDDPQVIFNLLCQKFIIVQATYTGSKITSYLNQSQGDNAWTFTSTVKLAGNDARDIPTALKRKLGALHENFSVQQFIIDLNTASLQTTPEISGVDKGSAVYNALNNVFINTYINSLKTKGDPVLNYMPIAKVAAPSNLDITSVRLYAWGFVGADNWPVANPTKEQKQLSTLNYYCATGPFGGPTPHIPSWNWLDNKADEADCDGVIAIRREIIGDFLTGLLAPLIQKNALVLAITGNDTSTWSATSSPSTNPLTWQHGSFHSPVMSTVYTHAVNDKYGWHGALGTLDLSTRLEASIDFLENKVIIKQHLVVFMDYAPVGIRRTANIFDKTRTDPYIIKVDDNGNLTMELGKPVALPTDDSVRIKNGERDVTDNIMAWIDNSVNKNFMDISLPLKNFVFPAGAVFSFKDPMFSDYQDLTVKITYSI